MSDVNPATDVAQPANSVQPTEVEILFTGVETPKRLQNREDEERGVVRHTFDVPAKLLKVNDLLDLGGPNPRTPKVERKAAAKRLRESLEGRDPTTVGSFHLAHGGVRGLVKSFEKIDQTTYRATFEVNAESRAEEDGIANGLHTIAVIQKALKSGEIPDGQYVTVTLIENVKPWIVPYIGEGLNTSIQVAEESIIDLAGSFEPFKAAVASKSYASQIGWQENEDAAYDARDVFAILNALNVVRYPSDDSERMPFESYDQQSKPIAAFRAETEDKSQPTSFNRMIPILNDALFLYDLIGKTAWERYRDAVPDGSPGSLAIMEKRLDRDKVAIQDYWEFPFISEGKAAVVTGPYKLTKGARFAMLSAFRSFVRLNDETGVMEWTGGFDEVLKAWEEIGGEMMVTAKEVAKTENYNLSAVGKNRPFWRQLFQIGATYKMKLEYDRMRSELDLLKLSKG